MTIELPKFGMFSKDDPIVPRWLTSCAAELRRVTVGPVNTTPPACAEGKSRCEHSSGTRKRSVGKNCRRRPFVVELQKCPYAPL